MAIQPAPTVDVSDLQEALADVATQRETFNRLLDQVKADANADSTRRRGRPLPEPSQGGDQIPAAGIQITEVISAREGTTRTRIVAGADVAWQNLANHLALVRARGNSKLDNQENSLRGIIAARQQPAGGGQPTAPRDAPGKDPKKLYPWVDFITEIIAYVVVFYGLVAAAHSFGFFTIGIVIALLLLTGLLQGVIIRPIQGAIKIVFNVLIQVILDIIEFIGTWLNGIIQYFQGDFIKAVLQILEVAAFMWLWSFAMRIPVIGQLIQFITDAVGQAIKFINDVFDQVTGFINRLRKDTENGLAQLFGNMGDFGKLLLQSVDAQIDRLTAGLTSRLNGLRFELIGDIDLVRKFVDSTITVFGFKLQLVPQEVRAYLLGVEGQQPVRAVTEAINASVAISPNATGNILPPVAPWHVLDELRVDLLLAAAGQSALLLDVAAEFRADLGLVQAGTDPDVGDWLSNPFHPKDVTGTIVTPPAQGLRPSWVPGDDWSLVRANCPAPHLAYLVAAIGWQETHWGQTGRGPEGYILGVGVTDTALLTQYQGLQAQLGWECPRLVEAFPTEGQISVAALQAYARDVRVTTAWQSWGQGVFGIYLSLRQALIVP